MVLLVAAMTGYTLYEMLAIVGFGDATHAQLVLVALFVATFFLMSVGAANAALGFIRLAFSRGDAEKPGRPAEAGGRVALVMPICNEHPQNTFEALSRMSNAIASEPWRRRVEIFVLSDTSDPAIGMHELHHAGILSQRFSGCIPVFYRRRHGNKGRKAGNVADFVRNWGGRYDYMIVLDADSYLTSASIGGLIDAMDRDQTAGLIQASIRLAGRDSLFARLQQFSTAVYGGVACAGAALWHGREGNFNGHNAIIRVGAFAASCGLPELPGGRPFGGDVLSHDFVEAALLRRAGWHVYTRLDINGTYEESPPNLIEYFKRDRRWMQGNLQHIHVLPARGLHWMSRVHLGLGILSYLTSLLWFLFLLAGISIAVYTTLVPQNYFPDAHSLFPVWPIFDAERAYHLTGLVLVIVLLPKFLGYLYTATHASLREAAGGWLRLAASTAIEIVFAALLAPLHMVVQIVHLAEILSGRDSGWPPQDREGSSISFRAATENFLLPSLAGIALAVASWSVSVSLFVWLTPIWTGLFLAIPMAMVTASRRIGLRARDARLLLIEEEHRRTGDGSPASQMGPDPDTSLARVR